MNDHKSPAGVSTRLRIRAVFVIVPKLAFPMEKVKPHPLLPRKTRTWWGRIPGVIGSIYLSKLLPKSHCKAIAKKLSRVHRAPVSTAPVNLSVSWLTGLRSHVQPPPCGLALELCSCDSFLLYSAVLATAADSCRLHPGLCDASCVLLSSEFTSRAPHIGRMMYRLIHCGSSAPCRNVSATMIVLVQMRVSAQEVLFLCHAMFEYDDAVHL